MPPWLADPKKADPLELERGACRRYAKALNGQCLECHQGQHQ